jgi:hypothetical protein
MPVPEAPSQKPFKTKHKVWALTAQKPQEQHRLWTTSGGRVRQTPKCFVALGGDMHPVPKPLFYRGCGGPGRSKPSFHQGLVGSGRPGASRTVAAYRHERGGPVLAGRFGTGVGTVLGRSGKRGNRFGTRFGPVLGQTRPEKECEWTTNRSQTARLRPKQIGTGFGPFTKAFRPKTAPKRLGRLSLR